MDINLLALSLGNSRLAVGTFSAGELLSVQRVGIDAPEIWGATIQEAWNRLSGVRAVAAASVNPPLEKSLQEIVGQTINQDIQWVGKQLDLPIEVLTSNPAQTGVDRILNVAAAYEQLQKACVVVDAGTAITINCCNDLGEFVGGAIAPGVNMLLESLHTHTAALPKVSFDVPKETCGRSTEEAIRSGVYHGIRGMVRELVEAYAIQVGSWPEVIATGGDAQKLFSGWELIHAISPDLTLYGIALAYAEHHIKNEG